MPSIVQQHRVQTWVFYFFDLVGGLSVFFGTSWKILFAWGHRFVFSLTHAHPFSSSCTYTRTPTSTANPLPQTAVPPIHCTTEIKVATAAEETHEQQEQRSLYFGLFKMRALLAASLCAISAWSSVEAAIGDAGAVTSVEVEAPLYDSNLSDDGGCDSSGCLGGLSRVSCV